MAVQLLQHRTWEPLRIRGHALFRLPLLGANTSSACSNIRRRGQSSSVIDRYSLCAAERLWRGSGALAAAQLVDCVDVCRVQSEAAMEELRDCLHSRPSKNVDGRALRLRLHKVLAACRVKRSIPRHVQMSAQMPQIVWDTVQVAEAKWEPAAEMELRERADVTVELLQHEVLSLPRGPKALTPQLCTQVVPPSHIAFMRKSAPHSVHHFFPWIDSGRDLRQLLAEASVLVTQKLRLMNGASRIEKYSYCREAEHEVDKGKKPPARAVNVTGLVRSNLAHRAESKVSLTDQRQPRQIG